MPFPKTTSPFLFFLHLLSLRTPQVYSPLLGFPTSCPPLPQTHLFVVCWIAQASLPGFWQVHFLHTLPHLFAFTLLLFLHGDAVCQQQMATHNVRKVALFAMSSTVERHIPADRAIAIARLYAWIGPLPCPTMPSGYRKHDNWINRGSFSHQFLSRRAYSDINAAHTHTCSFSCSFLEGVFVINPSVILGETTKNRSLGS